MNKELSAQAKVNIVTAAYKSAESIKLKIMRKRGASEDEIKRTLEKDTNNFVERMEKEYGGNKV